MPKAIDEVGLGPTRLAEWHQARTDYETAQSALDKLRAELAQVEQELATAQEGALVTAGVQTATLATAMVNTQALTARKAHLVDLAMPDATRQVQVTSRVYNGVIASHQRRTALEAEQQEIIAKAQARLEDIWQWRAE